MSPTIVVPARMLAVLPAPLVGAAGVGLLGAGIALWVRTAHLVRHPEMSAQYQSEDLAPFERWLPAERRSYVRRQRIRSLALVAAGVGWLVAAIVRG